MNAVRITIKCGPIWPLSFECVYFLGCTVINYTGVKGGLRNQHIVCKFYAGLPDIISKCIGMLWICTGGVMQSMAKYMLFVVKWSWINTTIVVMLLVFWVQDFIFVSSKPDLCSACVTVLYTILHCTIWVTIWLTIRPNCSRHHIVGLTVQLLVYTNIPQKYNQLLRYRE